MINPITTAQIFSKLGNSSSLLPIAVKDGAHALGMTTSSYITGKEVEGKDRLIDEFGTQLIWIGGIPFYKKMIDLSMYKIAGYNSKIDTRVIKDKKILEKAIENAPTKEIAESIEKAAKNVKTFKGLAMAKFVASTALTLASYWGLTTFRHKHTEKNLIKQIQQEEAVKTNAQKQKDKPSFGMKLSGLKDFMIDPVKNMMIVDGGITAERLAEARNPQDFMGYVVKEGSFWLFMYFAGPAIQKYLEKVASKKHNKSIDLDIRVLQNEEFKNAFKENKIKYSVKEMFQKVKIEKVETTNKKGEKEIVEKILNPEELYDFICKNKDNLVVKMMKQADLIKEHKETGKIDTQHYIDMDEVKAFAQKMENLFNQHTASKESVEDFLKKTVSLKRGSIIKNIGTCMGVLGVVVPGIMLAQRLLKKDNKDFAVKHEVREKLKKQGMIA